MPDNIELGPTAAIITIGDEIVEGRVLNKNATWLADELMARGVWPRVVVAVPDVSPLIVRVLRIAADTVDLLFVCGGLGFTPDDITRNAVATAFFRDVAVDTELVGRFRRENTWADERIAVAAATFPVDAVPLKGASGGVPGFRLRNAYVLPGRPAETSGRAASSAHLVADGGPTRSTCLTTTGQSSVPPWAVRRPAVRLADAALAWPGVARSATGGRRQPCAVERTAKPPPRCASGLGPTGTR